MTDQASLDAFMRKRYRKERWFKLYGLSAILFALLMLVLLVGTIFSNSLSAFHQHEIALQVNIDPARLKIGEVRDTETLTRAPYQRVVRDALKAEFPGVKGRKPRRALNGLVSNGADIAVRDAVLADPSIVGTVQTVWVKTSDDVDTYLKGQMTEVAALPSTEALTPSGTSGDVTIETPGNALADSINAQIAAGTDDASYLLSINGGIIKLDPSSANGPVLAGTVLMPLASTDVAQAGAWSLTAYLTTQGDRRISDQEIAWINALDAKDRVESRFNADFFATGDSREPELAGVWGAVVGSFFTLVITLSISFPIGLLAAIYLEEFARKNWITDVIEVNVNNLAAVPSIVYGLLGLAVFLNFFGMTRSAPVVGGIVLALMTLPTIIIASRAALKSVPPSIRQGALGVGATGLQTVFHHVLPLAMPGILTGTIIGLARALGETAPLLMIGMVAFIVDVPGGINDPATVMPVQIYLWADSPERAFVAKTSAAVVVLLAFLISMNLIAVLLRNRFERRW
jgi:phosphate transport system permease protein